MNNWIDFVRQYASSNKISYSKALKDPNCSKQYREKKAHAPSHLKGKTAKMYRKQDLTKEALLKFEEAKLKRKYKKSKIGSEPEPTFGVSFHY